MELQAGGDAGVSPDPSHHGRQIQSVLGVIQREVPVDGGPGRRPGEVVEPDGKSPESCEEAPEGLR